MGFSVRVCQYAKSRVESRSQCTRVTLISMEEPILPRHFVSMEEERILPRQFEY